ncbi:hypothetical protein CRYUN_Cryun38cG0074300 [Craigia yunnanensis]
MWCLQKAYQFLCLVLFFLNFLANLSSSSSSSIAQLCPHDEASALIQFKSSFSIHKTFSFSWFCEDVGIKSYPKTDSWNEVGYTAASIPIVNLQKLNLAFNYFTFSNMSSKFGEFASLEYLNLSQANFAGQVPSRISHLSKLVSLDLSRNDLQTLDKHTLKGLVHNLTEVSQLFLDQTDLSSINPNVLMNLSLSLKSLSLYQCGLRGKFPENIFYLPNLKLLNLGDNKNLCLSLPQFNRSSHLEILDLSNMNFSRELFDSIGWNLIPSKHLDLGSANISGSISKALGNLSKLNFLDLSGNSLSGKIPSSLIRNLTQLEFLNIGGNQLEGSIPDENSWQDSQVDVACGEGHFILLPWKEIEYLELSFNLIHGDLPIPPLQTRVFLISNNSFNGEISSLICSASSLAILDLSRNNLSGIIAQCFGNLSTLWTLNLGMNKFHGIIPPTFAKGCQLKNLNLNGNQLGGPLPRSVIHCGDLEVLDLGNNKINDTFPYWFGSLLLLQVLVLRSNQLQGSIHDTRSNLSFSKIQIFDLSSNYFTGPLPVRYIKSFKAMTNLEKDKSVRSYMGLEVGSGTFNSFSLEIAIKGLEIELVKVYTMLTSIDLSNNKFQGEIPYVIGKFNSLKGLNLSHNNLSGCIPYQ